MDKNQQNYKKEPKGSFLYCRSCLVQPVHLRQPIQYLGKVQVLEYIENEGNKSRPVKKISLFERQRVRNFQGLGLFDTSSKLGWRGRFQEGQGASLAPRPLLGKKGYSRLEKTSVIRFYPGFFRRQICRFLPINGQPTFGRHQVAPTNCSWHETCRKIKDFGLGLQRRPYEDCNGGISNVGACWSGPKDR